MAVYVVSLIDISDLQGMAAYRNNYPARGCARADLLLLDGAAAAAFA